MEKRTGGGDNIFSCNANKWNSQIKQEIICNFSIQENLKQEEDSVHVAHITLPTVISRYFKMLNNCAKSLAHMFRPSITPAKRYLSLGKPIVLTRLSVLVPRIRSNPIADIAFNRMMVLQVSIGKSAKYVSTSSLVPSSTYSKKE